MRLPCEDCGTPNSMGNYEPCCNYGDGLCETEFTNMRISNCIHCGSEMHLDESGFWRHHTQMELPLEERDNKHIMRSKPNNMEKIKTPLMLSIERKENKVISFRKEYEAYLELGNLDEMSRINAIVFELENEIEADKSLLPAERDMMIDFAQQYKSYCFQSEEFPNSARTRFTQTFDV